MEQVSSSYDCDRCGAGECVYYACSKNTAGNSNYDLRGAGECVFYAWSKNTAGNSNYDLRGAGECCLVPVGNLSARNCE